MRTETFSGERYECGCLGTQVELEAIGIVGKRTCSGKREEKAGAVGPGEKGGQWGPSPLALSRAPPGRAAEEWG